MTLILWLTHTPSLHTLLYWWWSLNYHPMHPSWHTSFVHPDAPKQFLNDKQWTTNPLCLPLPPHPLCLPLPPHPLCLHLHTPTLFTSPSTPTLLASQYTPTVYLSIHIDSTYLSIHPHCLSPHIHPLCLPLPPHLFKFSTYPSFHTY